MNKSKLNTIIVIGLLLSNIILVCFILFKKPPHPMRPKPREIIIEKLGFDENQVAAYDVIIKEHQKNIRNKEEQIMNVKKQLYFLVGNNIENNLKDSLITQLGNLQMDIENIHYSHFVEIKKICKPEQMERFNQLLDEIAILFSRPMMEKPK
jgi:UDP-glucose 6-dehydrogenase